VVISAAGGQAAVSERRTDSGSDVPSDESLVEAAQRGEVRALDALLSRHQDRVLRLTRLLGVPPQERDDVAQDVFIRVFRHIDSFRRGNPFSGWLYRVTVNVVHDHRRRTARSAAREEAWAGSDEDNRADDAPGPQASLEDRELARRLESALAHLTERERAVFVLREMEGLDSLEVARTLGVTRITVRRHLGLARRRLRTVLAGDEKK
jgi:RNA polymerase sigma-70 factor (ECF subfamily)